MEAPAPGRSIGHYRLESFLGSGPMGVVYLAHAPHIRRPVAVKVLAPERLDYESRRRLRIETVGLARLRHPNVARVFDFGSDAEHDYVVMELVAGCSLEQMVEAGPLENGAPLLLAAGLAHGLEAAHVAGLVHGCLTTGNVRVTPQHVLKILDFGLGLSRERCPLARLSGTPIPPAALRFLAPERLLGIEADGRADVFSAGAVIYEMISGRPLYSERDASRLIDAILNHAPAPLVGLASRKVDPRLEAIVLRALDKNPNQRFQNAADLARAIDALTPGARRAVARTPGSLSSLQRIGLY